MKVSEVVNDEIAEFAGGEFGVGFGVLDLVADPVRVTVGSVWAGGVSLAGEFGHTVFVVEVVEGEVEVGGEVLVEGFFAEGVGGAFVSSGF